MEMSVRSIILLLLLLYKVTQTTMQRVRTEEIQQAVTVVTVLCAEFFKNRPLLDIIKKITLL